MNEVGDDLKRLLEALADIERAERRLAVEVAVFHRTHDSLHPDSVPNWLRGAVLAAHEVLARRQAQT